MLERPTLESFHRVQSNMQKLLQLMSISCVLTVTSHASIFVIVSGIADSIKAGRTLDIRAYEVVSDCTGPILPIQIRMERNSNLFRGLTFYLEVSAGVTKKFIDELASLLRSCGGSISKHPDSNNIHIQKDLPETLHDNEVSLKWIFDCISRSERIENPRGL